MTTCGICGKEMEEDKAIRVPRNDESGRVDYVCSDACGLRFLIQRAEERKGEK